MRVFLCSGGSETALLEELGRAGRPGHQLAPGAVTTDAHRSTPDLDPVFARQALPNARAAEGSSVRALAEAAYATVEGPIDAWPGPFLIHAVAHAEPPPGLASRAAGVARELRALLAARRKRASRRERLLADVATVAGAAAFDDRWMLVQLLALSRDRLLVSAAAPSRAAARGIRPGALARR